MRFKKWIVRQQNCISSKCRTMCSYPQRCYYYAASSCKHPTQYSRAYVLRIHKRQCYCTVFTTSRCHCPTPYNKPRQSWDMPHLVRRGRGAGISNNRRIIGSLLHSPADTDGLVLMVSRLALNLQPNTMHSHHTTHNNMMSIHDPIIKIITLTTDNTHPMHSVFPRLVLLSSQHFFSVASLNAASLPDFPQRARQLSVRLTDLAGRDGFAGQKEFRIDVLEVPVERLTFQTLPQLLALGHVSSVALPTKHTQADQKSKQQRQKNYDNINNNGANTLVWLCVEHWLYSN